jgi:4-hydroxy-tetrahydrodipicolinate synthase
MADPPAVQVAVVTPFDVAGEVALDDHRHNVAMLRERGIDGFVLGGSTGEGPYLEAGERGRLTAAAREVLGDDGYLTCGVNAESVRQALAQADEAAAGGADAVLVMTPTTLVRGNDDAVAEFYAAVAAAGPLPVYLYTFSRVTAYELPVEHAIRLAAVPGIAGMKDSGGNPVRLQQVRAGAPGGFRLYAGSSAALALSVAAGADGSITASANYAPTLVREVVGGAAKSARRGMEAQERLSGLSRVVEARRTPGIKLAAEVAGLRPGLCRAPIPALPAAEGETLRRHLEALRTQLLG